MNHQELVKLLNQKGAAPEVGTAEHRAWLELGDALALLVETAAEAVPVYVSGPEYFLFSVLVPADRISHEAAEELLGWNFSVPRGWGYGYESSGATSEVTIRIFPPLIDTGTAVLEGAEPILFLRSFEGLPERSSYVELNQRFLHLTELHWLNRRDAYCKLSELGDIEDIIKTTYGGSGQHTVTTVRRDALDFYMALTETVLVRLFDVQRSPDWLASHRGEREVTQIRDEANGLFATRTIAAASDGPATAAWLRGFQLITSQLSADALRALLTGEERMNRRYATFIAHDWKHGTVHECSCDPAQLGNYFVPSDLPYQTTPAFFRPEVLARYRQDPEKYHLESGYLSCRGGWSLRYGINARGQVHAYLKDLGHLPYQEQQYWQSCNEAPKGRVDDSPRTTIGERAFTTDFMGTWPTDVEPAESLWATLNEFPLASHKGREVAIWAAPDEFRDRLASVLTYVMTDSVKEWQDHVLHLAQLLVEGLNERALRKLARHLECDDPKLRSIKLIRECLAAQGVDPSTLDTVTGPLAELWDLRSQKVAHRGGAGPAEDPRTHYRRLIERCDEAMQELATLVRAGYFNIP